MTKSVAALTLAMFVALPARGQVGRAKATFDSIAELIANGNPRSASKTVETLGYAAPGDGGGGTFYATNTVTGTNTGTRFFSGTAGWSWERVLDGQAVTPRMFGAFADGVTDDSDAIQAAEAYAASLGISSRAGAEFIVPSPIVAYGTVKLTQLGGVSLGSISGTYRLDSAGTSSYPVRLLNPDNAGAGMLLGNLDVLGALRFKTNLTELLVIDGDSLNSDGVTRWSKQLRLMFPEFGTMDSHVVSVSGSSSTDALARWDTNVLPLLSSQQRRRIYSLRTGINDLVGGASANAVYANLKSLWLKARTNGFTEIWAWTVMRSGFLSSAQDTERLDLNRFILSDQSLYDKVIQIDQVMTDPSNTNYFEDLTHPNEAGAKIEAITAWRSVGEKPWNVVPLASSNAFTGDMSWNTNSSNTVLVLNPHSSKVRVGTAFSLGREFGKLRLDASGSGDQPFAFMGTNDNVTGLRVGAVSVGTISNAPANGIATGGIIRQQQVGGFSVGADTGHYRIDSAGTGGEFRFWKPDDTLAGIIAGPVTVSSVTSGGIITSSDVIRQTHLGGFSIGADTGHFRIDSAGSSGTEFRFWKADDTLAGITVSQATVNFLEGVEIADPAAPAAAKGRVYFRDNGSGKVQLCVRFPTGAVQVIATEP